MTFSVAAVDLFASGMGAFLIIVVILFPYFLSADEREAEIEDLREAAREQSARAKSESERAADATEELEKVRRKQSGDMWLDQESPPDSLEFARGCWRTDAIRDDPELPPSVWRYCFDGKGKGHLLVTRGWGEKGEEICASAATVRREGDEVYVTDSNSRCYRDDTDLGRWFAEALICRPDERRDLVCQRSDSSAPRLSIRLHRG